MLTLGITLPNLTLTLKLMVGDFLPTGDDWGMLDLGHAVVDPLEVIYDGGDAVSN